MSAASKRGIELLKLGVPAPAPDDPAKRAELSKLMAGMEAKYASAKYCKSGEKECRDEVQLKTVMEESRNYDELLDAWKGWHDQARGLRDDYTRFVELGNEGARELGYKDLGAMWRSGYDMPADEFTTEAARLYKQVEPLYKDLQCYARGKLAAKYGEDKVPAGKPIPAHLFGNMWAQQWDAGVSTSSSPTLASASSTSTQRWSPRSTTRCAWPSRRRRSTSQSRFPALPQTFWERSMLAQPRDREVQCHASAWHMDGKEDVRIKMCTRPTLEEFKTLYHEMGHVYYDLWYKDQPYMFQNGAHDGFHEAIGDTVTLSMTPAYLAKIGLVPEAKTSKEAVINQQMKMALEKVAFLPFGKMIDEWRWQVFSGQVTPANYNTAWWELRREIPGHPPAGRAHGGRLRSGREVPHPGQHAVHALLPVFHPAVPVPESIVRCRRLQGSTLGMLDLRQRGRRQEIRRDAGERREPAMAGHHVRTDRHAADGRLGDHRLLQAVAGLAEAAERGQDLRLVMSRPAPPNEGRGAGYNARRPLTRL